MIKPIEYDGITWRVGFEYIPRREACKAQGGPTVTICRIWPTGIRIVPAGEFVPPLRSVRVLAGSAQCAPGDKPNYETGRKLALTRALASAPKDFRTAIWKAYLGRKKSKSKGDQ